jgi:DNA-binding MarR family transcriptional regulator
MLLLLLDKSACPSWLVYDGAVDTEPQETDLGILVGLAYQSFVEQLRAYLAEQGFDDLGRSDGYVFRALDRAPMTTSALAALLRISKQGAGQIVDDMQRRGLIERRPDPADARARLLYLAPRGRRALNAARRFHRRYERSLAARVGTAQVDTLRVVLTAMASVERKIDPATRGLYL